MNRRDTIIALIALASAAASRPSWAQQQGRVWRVGFLSPTSASVNPQYTGAFLQGMRELGYVEGKNLVVEWRFADGKLERLAGLAAELVQLKVDVIVAQASSAIGAAQKATTTIPIVMATTGDPLGSGFVKSLARPEGNITGISDVATTLSTKRLGLLKELLPKLQRVAMLWNKDDLGMSLRYDASAKAAAAMGVDVQAVGVREPDDFNEAFAVMDREPPDAILMVSDSLTVLNRKRVFDYAAMHRLPAIYEYDPLVREGGLMSYGPDLRESFERAGSMVDRILKGAKPADLPFEQPTRYLFVLNLKTAKSIGLEIPPTVLALADEVVE